MLTVIVTEKKSVADEYIKVLKLQEKNKGKYHAEGFSPVWNKDIAITWCRGHLVTMSYPEKYDEKYKKWNLADLPFIPDKYRYEVIGDYKEQFNSIKALYNRPDVGAIYYAGDSAREGLYIQLLVRQEAHIREGIDERVVWIDSFTEEEILRGIREAKPLSEYTLKGYSAYMRAIEDYVIGINFSRALSCKFGYQMNKKLNTSSWKSISVGRVMTCVLALVTEREREIRNFKETPFYKIAAENGAEWRAVEGTQYFESPLLYAENGFKERTSAEKLCQLLNADKRMTVADVNKKTEKKGAPLLFNLAEAQNFCGNKYKITPEQTHDVIQSLYEKKLVTYPRTDARVLSSAVGKKVEKNLKGLLSLGYKTDIIKEALAMGRYKTIVNSPYVDDSKISDHYAIIPTGAVSGYNGLKDLEKNIYHDIVERFVSIFFPAAEYEKIEVRFSHSKKEYLFLSQKVLRVPGYLKVIDKAEIEEPIDYKKGQIINTVFEIKEGKTTGPKRYTSASMIIAMENAGKLIEDEELRATIKGSGIGTSATRGAILEKLVDNEYLALNKKTQILTPTVLGECIYDIVRDNMPKLTSPEMTANWELGLTQIESGKVTYAQYRDALYNYVRTEVGKVSEKEGYVKGDYEGGGGLVCPVCGKGKILSSANSKSFFCSEYKNGCKFSIWKNYRGIDLSMADVTAMINKGKSGRKTFKKKDGTGEYSGYVTYKDGNVNFEFAKTRKSKGA